MARHRKVRPQISEEERLAAWFGPGYVDTPSAADQEVPVAVPQPVLNGHRDTLHHPLTFGHYQRKAHGRPYKLAVGRLVLPPDARRLDRLFGQSNKIATDLGMDVRRTPTVYSARHTTMYEPGRADAILRDYRDSVQDDDTRRNFSENPLTISGSVDVRRRGTLVEVAFKLESQSDVSEDLLAEHALIKRFSGEEVIGNDTGQLSKNIPIITAYGLNAAEFVEETSQLWTPFDGSEIDLSYLGLVAMYRVNQGPANRAHSGS